ncbi:MAG: HlyC/CorC family transporter [Gammaproteobacteria bacterium]
MEYITLSSRGVYGLDQALITYLIIILVLLIVLSAFFSGAEVGMMAINRYRLRYLAKQKQRSALRVSRLLERPDRLLGIILIGNTFANILASAIATILAMHWLGEIGIVVATILLTLIILIFAEITPKTFAALYPQKVAWFASRPLSFLLKLLTPFVWLVNLFANNFLCLLGIDLKKPDTEKLTEGELRNIVHETEGLISDAHKQMLLAILDLEKAVVEDIMVPRNEIVAIDLGKPWDEILEQIKTSQHTRLPIYKENMDDVQGIIHLRKVVQSLSADKFDRELLIAMAENCYFVLETTPLHSQLLNFQQHKERMCLVVNEYGDIEGLATLDDILEEVVGEFTTDFAATSKDISPQEDGSVIVDGSVTLRDLNRAMQWELATSGPKTLNGIILEHLEFIPSAGTSVLINHYPIEVMQVKDNMIKTVKIFPRKI